LKSRYNVHVLAVIGIATAVLCSQLALASTPPTNRDIPFLERQEIGARWAGMGGACIAIVDDGAAAFWNPAGLARIRRIEVTGTIGNRSLDVDADWFGTDNQSSVSTTRLGNLAVSYPFPTYRGSLVATGSLFRSTSFDQYVVREGNDGSQGLRDTEEKKVVLSAWSGAFALQLSPNAFFGVEAHFYTGDLSFDDNLDPWDPCPDGAIFSQDGDLSGYGGTAGFIYVPHPLVALGLTLKTPQRLTVEGEEVWTGEPGCSYYNPSIKYDVDLPYSVGIGIGVMPASFTIALDVVYTDWHQLEFPGGIRDDDGDFMYNPTTDIRFGVEYGLTAMPVRVRAGYAYVPMALDLFDIEKNRSRFSVGAGTVIESSLVLDVAWQRSSFERESISDSYSEKRTLDRMILSFAYRF
jgi:long-subunit fatty acid transport protein